MAGPIDLITANIDESNPSAIHAEIDKFVSVDLPAVIPQINSAYNLYSFNDAYSQSFSVVTIGTGTINFVVDADKSFYKGMYVVAADSVDPASYYMIGQVINYNGSILQMESKYKVGSGSRNSWVISFSAPNQSLTDSHEIVVSGQNGRGSINTAIARFSTTEINIGTDITYADSATLGGSFTIVNPGIYAMTYEHGSSVVSSFGITLNSTELTTAFSSVTFTDTLTQATLFAANKPIVASVVRKLAAGDVIRAHENTTGTPVANTRFTINKLQSI